MKQTPKILNERDTAVLLITKNHAPLGYDEKVEATLLSKATLKGKGLQGEAILLNDYLPFVYFFRMFYALDFEYITLETTNTLLISVLEDVDANRGFKVLRELQKWNYNEFGNQQSIRVATFHALYSELSNTQMREKDEDGNYIDLFSLDKASIIEHIFH